MLFVLRSIRRSCSSSSTTGRSQWRLLDYIGYFQQLHPSAWNTRVATASASFLASNSTLSRTALHTATSVPSHATPSLSVVSKNVTNVDQSRECSPNSPSLVPVSRVFHSSGWHPHSSGHGSDPRPLRRSLLPVFHATPIHCATAIHSCLPAAAAVAAAAADRFIMNSRLRLVLISVGRAAAAADAMQSPTRCCVHLHHASNTPPPRTAAAAHTQHDASRGMQPLACRRPIDKNMYF